MSQSKSDKPERVTRLPVQHKKHPHCPNCHRDILSFDDMVVSTTSPESPYMKILAITIHVQCDCGTRLDLLKTSSDE